MSPGPQQIHVTEFHERMRGQGVSRREHVAFKCPMCGTVQSIAMMVARAGISPEDVETVIGFSCIGRWLNAGPWTDDPDGRAKRAAPGCDWTLGGLLHIHKIEVITERGTHPSFELASPAEAQTLQAATPWPSDGIEAERT